MQSGTWPADLPPPSNYRELASVHTPHLIAFFVFSFTITIYNYSYLCLTSDIIIIIIINVQEQQQRGTQLTQPQSSANPLECILL